jgi:LCP family protein required for cell wall assembly
VQKRSHLSWFFLSALLLFACNLIAPGGIGLFFSGGQPLVVAAANATLTPTPFQPLQPTPVITPTIHPRSLGEESPVSTGSNSGRAWGSYPGPSAPAAIAIPPPMGLFDQPEGQTNILLMGSDQRPDTGGFRTDVLLLLTLNPSEGTVNLTSFPRDLFVYIPGWTMERVNTAQARGGFELTALTFEYNFGVRPDHWALINFSGFTTIINALGGINVQVAQPLSDQREGYGTYYVPAGTVHMDGSTALWYVRSRYTSSDFDRTRRQQEVIQAVFFRLMSLDGVTKAPQLYQQYQQAILTDMSLDDIIPLLSLATKLADGGEINRYAIGPGQVTSWVNPLNGAQVLLPNRTAVREIMQQALNAQ